MNRSVAVLGPSTYSEEAASWLLQGTDWRLVPCKGIADVFESTLSGRTAFSVVPVENTFEGSVSLHIDWLVNEADLPIQTEWVYPIHVNLMSLPQFDGEWRRIRKVLSHQVAFAQCRRFLNEHLPEAELEAVGSTAEGARLVGERGDPFTAAIGPATAGARYGLKLLAPAIQDHKNNFTRFVLAGKEPMDPLRPEGRGEQARKTTLLLMPGEDFPGGLHQLLSAFAWRRLNLTKIESRPTKRQLGTYYFYVDVDASMESVLLRGAVEEIRAVGCAVRVLGSYPTYGFPEEKA
ncbi:prephenate dehydratase [Paenibacillus sp.]|uniref:prephenate dehydratase n=1 Tax=Paenibacillus sp. TaxID=58172 RepID=UPI002811B9F1|nr:prephenate dehydratase [Paenibacillus sp.]